MKKPVKCEHIYDDQGYVASYLLDDIGNKLGTIHDSEFAEIIVNSVNSLVTSLVKRK